MDKTTSCFHLSLKRPNHHKKKSKLCDDVEPMPTFGDGLKPMPKFSVVAKPKPKFNAVAKPMPTFSDGLKPMPKFSAVAKHMPLLHGNEKSVSNEHSGSAMSGQNSGAKSVSKHSGSAMSGQNGGAKSVSKHSDTTKPTSKSLVKDKELTREVKSKTDIQSLERRLSFVCISDTHGKLDECDIARIPPGDVLLHAGDFTMYGTFQELRHFNDLLGKLPHRYKVVIAGNHETCLEEDSNNDPRYVKLHRHYLRETYGVTRCRDLLTNCIYLEDELVDICGIKIYGSPHSPQYSTCDAFSVPRNKPIQEQWEKIPDRVDILMTHGPPYGICDSTVKGDSAGCKNLLDTVQNRVKPKYHVFGHIHEGYGMHKTEQTTFINASMCTRGYNPTNHPVKFHLDIPNPSICNTECPILNRKPDVGGVLKLNECGTETAFCDKIPPDKCENIVTDSYQTTEDYLEINSCDTEHTVCDKKRDQCERCISRDKKPDQCESFMKSDKNPDQCENCIRL